MKFRQALFWDTDPAKIDPKKNTRYIIERILELGELDDISWVFKQYSKSEIRKVMNLARSQVSTKSRTLWTLLLK